MEEHYANKDLGVVIEQAGPEAKTPLDLEIIDKNLSAHSSVKGRYLLETRSSSVEPPASFEMVSDPNTAIRGHKVTYWCSNTNTD
jgi:hypothetical protein